MIRYLFFVSLIVLSFVQVSCSKDSAGTPIPPSDTTTTTPPPDTTAAVVVYDNDNLLFGNPSNASASFDNNYLMVKPAFTLSYNRERGTPNWVSWHLYSADMGSASRQDDFLPDGALPYNWNAITTASYTGSGFDRGHDCPSGDRTANLTVNGNTFLMTNIIPQAPKLNQGPWNEMENYIRSLVLSGSEAYIIMGNYGEGGTGNNGFATHIDNGAVTVPATVWKVAVILQNGNNDTARVTASTRVIAVAMPNENSVGSDWKKYRTSVDYIEAQTRLDLLSRLPAEVQATIEANVDTQ